MSNYIDLPVEGGGSSGVTSLNSLVGALTLVAGANITITPSGSNITIAGASFDPRTTISLFDDFITGFYWPSNGQIPGDSAVWSGTQTGSPTIVGNTGSIIPSTAVNPGVIEFGTSTGSAYGAGITTGVTNGATYGAFVTGGGQITFEALINIPALSNGTDNAQINVGFRDGPGWNGSSNAWNIMYQIESSPNWQLLVQSAGVQTTFISSIAVTTGWHHIKLVCDAAGANISGFIDTVSMGSPVSTNIPTTNLPPMLSIRKTLGTTAMYLGLDYINIVKTLTTPR